MDASLIRTDVNWRSSVQVHVTKMLAENETLTEESFATVGRSFILMAGKMKMVSIMDPEAFMITVNHRQRMEPIKMTRGDRR